MVTLAVLVFRDLSLRITPKRGHVDTSFLHDLAIDNNASDYTFTPADERLFLLDLYDAKKSHLYNVQEGNVYYIINMD